MNVTPALVSKMFEYNVWAFDLVWDCVEELSDEQFCQEVDYSRGSIRNQMVHVISTCERWFERIQGRAGAGLFGQRGFPDQKDHARTLGCFLRREPALAGYIERG